MGKWLKPTRDAVAVVLTLISMVSCSRGDESLHSFGPEQGEDSLLVVFRADASAEQIQDVLESRLSVRHPESGTLLLPGMRSSVRTSVGGYVAYQFAFRPTSSLEQRRNARGLAENAPSVLAVFENLSPSVAASKLPVAPHD
jgi:hypothetical protein